jgi:hypothetical protein
MDAYERRVLSTTEVRPDKMLRTSIIDAGEAGTYIEVREYIPSQDAYARGVTFPPRVLASVLEGLQQAAQEVKDDD